MGFISSLHVRGMQFKGRSISNPNAGLIPSLLSWSMLIIFFLSHQLILDHASALCVDYRLRVRVCVRLGGGVGARLMLEPQRGSCDQKRRNAYQMSFASSSWRRRSSSWRSIRRCWRKATSPWSSSWTSNLPRKRVTCSSWMRRFSSNPSACSINLSRTTVRGWMWSSCKIRYNRSSNRKSSSSASWRTARATCYSRRSTSSTRNWSSRPPRLSSRITASRNWKERKLSCSATKRKRRSFQLRWWAWGSKTT